MRRMYSEKQIDSQIKEVINSGEAVINSKWEYEQDLEFEATWLNGCVIGNKYAKLLEKNGVLYIVVSLELINETASNITIPTNSTVFSATLRDDIASKIYRKDGTNLLVAKDSIPNILTKIGYSSGTSGGTVGNVTINISSDVANVLYMWARNTITVEANGTKLFDFRAFITL